MKARGLFLALEISLTLLCLLICNFVFGASICQNAAFIMSPVSLGNRLILSMFTDGFNSRSFVQQIFRTTEKKGFVLSANVKTFDTSFEFI